MSLNRSFHQPRMRMVWEVLEIAKDVGHEPTISACRRLIRANSRGWQRHHDPLDWEVVKEIFEEMRESEDAAHHH